MTADQSYSLRTLQTPDRCIVSHKQRNCVELCGNSGVAVAVKSEREWKEFLVWPVMQQSDTFPSRIKHGSLRSFHMSQAEDKFGG